MDSLMKADIFFFTTTILVVTAFSLIIVAIIYAIKILGDVKHISKTVREESDELIEDIGNLRRDIKKRGFRLSCMFDFFLKLFRINKKDLKKEKKN